MAVSASCETSYAKTLRKDETPTCTWWISFWKYCTRVYEYLHRDHSSCMLSIIEHCFKLLPSYWTYSTVALLCLFWKLSLPRIMSNGRAAIPLSTIPRLGCMSVSHPIARSHGSAAIPLPPIPRLEGMWVSRPLVVSRGRAASVVHS
jgi:hypothetical protein